MSSRILIISSYNGPRHNTRGILPGAMLAYQHQQLTKLRHKLDKILVVSNEGIGPLEELSLFSDVLHRTNEQGSYGGWRAAYEAHPNYEWYFFLEDDYTFALDDFDQIMIDMWTPTSSYLAERVFYAAALGNVHTSISNGLTRGDILAKAKWELLTAEGQYNSALQMGWSGLFEMAGLGDITEKYSTPFWNGEYVKYWNDEDKPALIIPVQML